MDGQINIAIDYQKFEADAALGLEWFGGATKAPNSH